MKTIYILEDNPDIAYILTYLLAEEGYQVEAFGTICDCRAAFNNHKPDLMLLDVQLPDGNGLDLYHEIKSATPSAAVPVFVMSASQDPALKDLKEAIEFISKPFNLDQIVHKIATHLKPA